MILSNVWLSNTAKRGTFGTQMNLKEEEIVIRSYPLKCFQPYYSLKYAYLYSVRANEQLKLFHQQVKDPQVPDKMRYNC